MQDVIQQVQKTEIRAPKEKLLFSCLEPRAEGQGELWGPDSPLRFLTYLIVINGPGSVLSSLHILARIMGTSTL